MQGKRSRKAPSGSSSSSSSCTSRSSSSSISTGRGGATAAVCSAIVMCGVTIATIVVGSDGNDIDAMGSNVCGAIVMGNGGDRAMDSGMAARLGWMMVVVTRGDVTIIWVK